MRVLLAEDSEAVALAMKKKLLGLGCLVDVATSDKEVTAVLTKNAYDIVFISIDLSGMAGIKVAQKARVLTDAGKCEVPIIALTKHHDKQGLCLAAGMHDVLLKPVKLEQIEFMLNRYVVKETDSSIIDWEGCVRILDGDEESAREVLGMFSKGLKISSMVLEDAYKGTNVKVLRDELHKLRGGVCYLKLPQLQQKLNAFHLAAREESQDAEEIKACYEALMLAIKDFYGAFDVLNLPTGR